jgi:hypothetical protein
MKWQLLGDWPVGQFLIPAGTIIDSEGNGRDLPLPPPFSKALDQSALDCLCLAHGEEAYHLLHYERGLVLPPKGYPPKNPLKASPPIDLDLAVNAVGKGRRAKELHQQRNPPH